MHVSDKVIYLFLFFVSVTFIGMLFQSWRVILYPYLIVIGITILIGLWKPIRKRPHKIWIPIAVSVIYLILYGLLDFISSSSILGGDYYIFGMTPSMALFMLGILPCAVIICLLYAITFPYEKQPSVDKNNHDVKGVSG